MSLKGMVRTAVVIAAATGVAGVCAAGKAPEAKKTTSKVVKRSLPADQVLFDFEKDLQGWRIPDWAFEKKDNASLSVMPATDKVAQGKGSLKLAADFPPKMWSGAYVEIERQPGEFMDFTGFDTVQAGVYLAPDAPKKLKAELIMTVGDDWSWTEMRKAVDLIPGQWNVVSADIGDKSVTWKIPMTDDVRSDVRKLGVRIQSNYITYKGMVHIDDVRLTNKGGSGKK
jgi:hypothetical protein